MNTKHISQTLGTRQKGKINPPQEAECRYALITGASQGLGRCYALELARLGFNTLLVALPGSGLREVATESRSLGVESIPFETDLCDEKALSALCRHINARYSLCMIINNAGTGGTKLFTTCPPDYLDHILSLNVRVPVLLIRYLLPNLRHAPQGFILNVASMAAFSPVGFKTVYPASKRFILQFSLGLREELRGTGISVSSVAPGPMKTNAEITRRIERQGAFGKLGLLSPEQVAHLSLQGLFRRKAVILPGWSNHINRLLLSLIPTALLVPLMSRVIAREINAPAIHRKAVCKPRPAPWWKIGAWASEGTTLLQSLQELSVIS